jgi:glycosyltransferase involved in cell wall biosynthesis
MIIVDLDSLQISKENAIVALGNFDGMHRGHQKLFQIAVQEHRTKGITPSVLLFKTHTREAFRAHYKQLQSLQDKIETAARFGIEKVFLLSFTEQILRLSPEAFVDQILIQYCNASALVAGTNYTFGYRARGDVLRLSDIAKSRRLDLHIAPDVHMPEGAQDFRLMRKKVVDAILAMPEYHRFSKGIFSWVGFDTVWIEHTDTERVAGKTKWNFFSSFQYAIDGMLSFSTKPLSMMVLVGLIISLIGFLYALYVVITTLSGVESAPGFPTLVSLILFFSGITILSIGLMGLYVARIYLEVKARPHYLIAETNLQETHHG